MGENAKIKKYAKDNDEDRDAVAADIAERRQSEDEEKDLKKLEPDLKGMGATVKVDDDIKKKPF